MAKMNKVQFILSHKSEDFRSRLNNTFEVESESSYIEVGISELSPFESKILWVRTGDGCYYEGLGMRQIPDHYYNAIDKALRLVGKQFSLAIGERDAFDSVGLNKAQPKRGQDGMYDWSGIELRYYRWQFAPYGDYNEKIAGTYNGDYHND